MSRVDGSFSLQQFFLHLQRLTYFYQTSQFITSSWFTVIVLLLHILEWSENHNNPPSTPPKKKVCEAACVAKYVYLHEVLFPIIFEKFSAC